MKHIRNFEGFRIRKNRSEIIRESVLQVNDIYKVKTMVDIPQSLINAYVKKVKDNTGKNLRQFFGDVDIAEEIVKYITINNVDVEKIPGNALMGGAQAQGQEQVQVQAEAETEDKEEQKAQVSEEEVKEEEPKVEEPKDEEFEEPKAQVAEEEKAEEEEKVEKEEVSEEEKEEVSEEEEKEEGTEELPL